MGRLRPKFVLKSHQIQQVFTTLLILKSSRLEMLLSKSTSNSKKTIVSEPTKINTFFQKAIKEIWWVIVWFTVVISTSVSLKNFKSNPKMNKLKTSKKSSPFKLFSKSLFLLTWLVFPISIISTKMWELVNSTTVWKITWYKKKAKK